MLQVSDSSFNKLKTKHSLRSKTKVKQALNINANGFQNKKKDYKLY